MSEQSTIRALKDKPTIVIERWFDAPRELVYRACTQPELLKQWWAPCEMELIVCEVDLKPGGNWRFVVRAPDGRQDGFRGVYRELVTNERVARTFIYDPYPDADALEICTLEDHGSRTKLVVAIEHKTFEARDGHLQSGMEHGMRAAHAQLDAVLATLVDATKAARSGMSRVGGPAA